MTDGYLHLRLKSLRLVLHLPGPGSPRGRPLLSEMEFGIGASDAPSHLTCTCACAGVRVLMQIVAAAMRCDSSCGEGQSVYVMRGRCVRGPRGAQNSDDARE